MQWDSRYIVKIEENLNSWYILSVVLAKELIIQGFYDLLSMQYFSDSHVQMV